MTDSLTDNLKSRDASASKKYLTNDMNVFIISGPQMVSQCLSQALEGEQHRHGPTDAEHRGRDHQGLCDIQEKNISNILSITNIL